MGFERQDAGSQEDEAAAAESDMMVLRVRQVLTKAVWWFKPGHEWYLRGSAVRRDNLRLGNEREMVSLLYGPVLAAIEREGQVVVRSEDDDWMQSGM
jgi:hypothetical protein